MSTKDMEEKAKALLTLKDSLGQFYDAQKEALLNQVIALPLADAAPLLNILVQLNFIDSSELAGWFGKLVAGPSVISISTDKPNREAKDKGKEKVDETSTTVWDDQELGKETKLLSISQSISEKTSIPHGDVNSILNLLSSNLSVQTIIQLVDVEESHRQFNVLDEFLQPDQLEIFYKIFKLLLDTLPELQQELEAKKSKIDNLTRELTTTSHHKRIASSQTYHLWNTDSQILFVPIESKAYFFSAIEIEDGKGQIKESSSTSTTGDMRGEYVIFCLDSSASMNHDAKGSYLSPQSLDDPASSIKKARNLIAPLFMAALKRMTPVSLLVWNSKAYPQISFTPEDFLEIDSKDFIDDEEIKKIINSKTGENVFRATGGTNIEAALRALVKQIEDLEKTTSNIVVWFLTDGEETRYLEQSNVMSIPTNKSLASYTKFNVPDATGLTQYQKEMVDILKNAKDKLNSKELRTTLEFHVCHFGEAHPLFLKGLREAVGGHFHAVADVDKLQKEMLSMATTNTDAVLTIESGGKTYQVPAATSEGTYLARGELPIEFLYGQILSQKQVVLKMGAQQRTLKMFDFAPLNPVLKEAVGKILSLEPALGNLLTSISENITPSILSQAIRSLKELRKTRSDTITSVIKLVKRGSILLGFLEKVLEAVETQMNSLERMLEQYQTPVGEDYDAKIAKNSDFFSQREQMAIEAGLDSMRVRLGSGIVTKTSLDKKIQRLVVTNGSWARKMLARVCLIAETPGFGSKSKLTLLILEGYEHQASKSLIVEKFSAESEEVKQLSVSGNLSSEVEEAHYHDKTTGELISKITVTFTDPDTMKHVVIEKEFPTSEVYPHTVCNYTVEPETTDLGEACKRLLDPLSFCSFIDLIKEQNTLPAYLYEIGSNQSMGLLYNAKEMLYVQSGGLDCTSFGYFRLYWRLAEKEDEENGGNLVQVPGTFSKANFALPIAPEPLSNLVLSSLLPGLLSEFITGTPMAPLSESGLFYVGYLLMHMRNRLHSGVDISRISEILSSLSCWIDNPKTLPKNDEVDNMINMLVKEKGLPPSESPGKNYPVKAFALSLLDTKHPAGAKYVALEAESWRRYWKQLLGKQTGKTTPEKGIPINLAKHQISSADFIKRILISITGENPDDPANGKDFVPDKFMNMSETLFQLTRGSVSEDEVLKFLLQDSFKNLRILVDETFKVIHTIGDLAFSRNLRWKKLQRLFFVWYAIGTYPFDKVKNEFAAFRQPTEFEKHVGTLLDTLKTDSTLTFSTTLLSWLEETGTSSSAFPVQHYTLNYVCDSASDFLQIKNSNTSEITGVKLDEPSKLSAHSKETLLKLWAHISAALKQFHWRGRKSNAYGILTIDYDIIKAMKDSSNKSIEGLTQGQLSEFYKAKEGRSTNYADYAPPKCTPITLDSSNHFVIKQAPRWGSGKPRLSVVVIGNVNSGKSTTTGHIISECGFIDQNVIKRFERDARILGRESFKFAWVMDQLKQERERGVTIEVGMWNIETTNFDVDILDAPGHRDFVKNMSVGASMADAALLVVSAAQGEFEAGIARGGMTREESLISFSTGVKQFIVLVNKMDIVGYAEARFTEIVQEVSAVLKKIGVSEKRIVYIPVSGWVGDNLIKQSDAMPWYDGWKLEIGGNTVTGYTLMDAINLGLQVPTRPVDKPVRIPILKAHKVAGIGTVAIGRVAAGVLKKGDSVVLQPGNVEAQVTSIEIHHTDRDKVIPGDLVGFRVKNLTVKDMTRGMVACGITQPPAQTVTSFVAMVVVLSGVVKKGARPFFLCHTASFAATFVELLQKVDKRTGAVLEEAPTSIRTSEAAIVRLRPDKPIMVEPFQVCAPLGRLIIRQGNLTVGVGVVRSIDPPSAKPKPKFVAKKYFK